MAEIFFDAPSPPPENARGLTPLRKGETVEYVLTKRLSPSKAVVHIRGAPVIAEIPAGYPERGTAVVTNVGAKITLALTHRHETRFEEGAVTVAPPDSVLAKTLIAHGLKPNEENIRYLAALLRLASPPLSERDLHFTLSLMRKDLYIPLERLEPFFNGAPLLAARDALRKSAHGNSSQADKFITLTEEAVIARLGHANAAHTLQRAVKENGFWYIFALLFNEDAGDDALSQNAKRFLEAFAWNKKGPKGKPGSYAIPLFFEAEGVLEAGVLILERKGNGNESEFSIDLYKNEERIVTITVIPKEGNAVVNLEFYDAVLFRRYCKAKRALEQALEGMAITLSEALYAR